ncbi:hypothetical protein BMF94_5638 [Rhodotorula taiwanensis]|uniref:Uncharacterized protein n=1 Tax=Rhodotorula taiwanensis TaxID=741276 RepID=A0A2S5B3J7_9BASI|nr:hypothetical protein BMF94_5638 [Rhodotorula taiwanensis]
MSGRPERTASRARSSDGGTSSEDLTEYELPLLPDLTATRSPTERFRRVDTALAFLGTGCLGVGSALLIAFYVTGPPRFNDLASTTTVVLLLTLVAGLASSLPSWYMCTEVARRQSRFADAGWQASSCVDAPWQKTESGRCAATRTGSENCFAARTRMSCRPWRSKLHS